MKLRLPVIWPNDQGLGAARDLDDAGRILDRRFWPYWFKGSARVLFLAGWLYSAGNIAFGSGYFGVLGFLTFAYFLSVISTAALRHMHAAAMGERFRARLLGVILLRRGVDPECVADILNLTLQDLQDLADTEAEDLSKVYDWIPPSKLPH